MFFSGPLAHTRGLGLGLGLVRRACLTLPYPQELDSLRHQVDQLVEENVELELELQRSLELPPGSPGEREWSPSGGAGAGGSVCPCSCGGDSS